MELTKSKKANINYLAKIVQLNEFTPHNNADALKCAHVGGYTIIVGKNEPTGTYVYFPTSCTLNPQLLQYANLYRHVDKNSNPEAKAGFFEDNGRVKAIKLRGIVSEGFLLPTLTLENFFTDSFNKSIDLSTWKDTEFDSIKDGDKEAWICKKYVVERRNHGYHNNSNKKKKSDFTYVIDEFFREHYETEQVKRNPFCICSNDLIHCSSKIDGTSTRAGWVKCNKKLPKLIKWFYDKVGIPTTEYRYLYGSHHVVKNDYGYNKSGYYTSEPFEAAFNVIKPYLVKGMVIYSEIVGYNPNGSYIQKNYDYGCVPPENGEYIHDHNFKVRPYRITLTNDDGVSYEFSAKEVQTWCLNHGLTPVWELYYGIARDLYPDIKEDADWNTNFWERLANDKKFYMECNSPECENKVPHEGLVIRREDGLPHAFKLKCWKYVENEGRNLDAGEENLEDEN